MEPKTINSYIKVPEFISAWTALENALNEISKARESLDKLIHHAEQYADGTVLMLNDDIEEYMPLYVKLSEAERAANAAQKIIDSIEYKRNGGFNGLFGSKGEEK